MISARDLDRRAKLAEWKKKRNPGGDGAKGKNQVAGKALTPSKLVFSGPCASNKAGKDKENTPVVNTQSIRAKLVQSAKKKKQALAEKKSKVLEEGPRKVVEKVKHVKPKSDNLMRLKQMIDAQLGVFDELLTCSKHQEARDFLKQVIEEIPQSLESGDLWARLVKLELDLGNTRRACCALSYGLQNTKMDYGKLLELCVNVVGSEILHGQQLPPRDELFTAPFKHVTAPVAASPDQILDSVIEEDNELDAYLQYNPNTTAKKRKSLGPAKRIVTNESAKKLKFSVDIEAKNNCTGRFVTMASVKTKKTDIDGLGSEVRMTPVRRSARVNKTKSRKDTASILKDTNYTYTPNKFVQDEEEELLG
uniref:Uncharacterized protein n=1 Tax=Mucochytrium quahogii TaxID=96639 RepID=A0A7S2R9B1_9STRA|mmetsp:Transcript_42995/g.69053  ORF Transcript_42995/g.69053 Transcript_42995/m.69053 type:complete len:364 (+) Transcript_42995:207-1298(+)